MLNGHGHDSFIWQHFLRASTRVLIVLPSPHGDYKSGISYSDARAAAEIRARLHALEDLDVQTPETLADRVATNLILIAGKKANRVTENFEAAMDRWMNFQLEDGLIYDKERQALVTPQFLKGAKRTIDTVTL